MKKTILYSLLVLLSACANKQETSDSQVKAREDQGTPKNTCFCDVDSNLNLIPDSIRNLGMQLWKDKISSLFPDTQSNALPKGFQISIADMRSLANLLNEEKNPAITDVMGYFMFKSAADASAGRISVVFVPHYEDAAFRTCPDCKNQVSSGQSQSINVDLTNPCPPACN